MPAKAKPKELEESAPAERDPLILTISELNQLSDKEKQAFREAGGTSIEDPR